MLRLMILCLYLEVANCLNHCEKITIDEKYWKNEGAAVIYIMKSSQPNWQGQVPELIHLKKSLRSIGVGLQLTVATNKNCSAYQTISEFRIDGGYVWNQLEHHTDYPEAYVIDRCGKVTYHLIFPWSLHKFPFIKGAILSTFFDKPCGPCDMFHSYHIDPPKDFLQDNRIKIYPKMTENSLYNDSEEIGPPIEIIIPEKHKHEGNNEVFEYSEIELDNNLHHRHFHSLDDIEFYDDNEIKTERHKRDENSKSGKLRESSEIDLDRMNKKLKEIGMLCGEADPLYMQRLYRNLNKAINSNDDQFNTEDNRKKEEISRHYEKLKNWISYIV